MSMLATYNSCVCVGEPYVRHPKCMQVFSLDCLAVLSVPAQLIIIANSFLVLVMVGAWERAAARKSMS